MSKSFTANDAPLTDTPPHITELGHTQAERNRYFVFCLSLIGAVLLALSFSWYAFTQAMHNKEILFIKMMPNGTWQSVEYHAQDKQLFFKTTVDSLLARYAERRYGVIPATVAADYGEAQVFMDDNLRAQFLSPTGYNAIEKAAKYAQNAHNDIKITWRFNDHYDRVTGNVAGVETDIMRSNIYFTRTIHIQGNPTKTTKMMLSVQWRLLPKTELEKQDKEFLKVNPIGLIIVSETLTTEPNQ
uniref:Hypothetical conjugal transfer protein n=1 Tax=Vibrio sp. 23023 TaxID=452803 RepID=A9M4T1_9VIBR|nr:VirB8/TrbF family protein [Vibrio sp. 23023]ABX77032.1 Hypothetical conjugal transfer protein [Vibrio sp. 23023]